VEDFSQMTVEDKQNAPIGEVGAEFSMGKIAAGKVHKYMIPVKNSGVNPLEIRRAYCPDPIVQVKTPKAIKSGKKGALTVEVNAKNLNPGNYSRDIIVITNDYKAPIKKVKLNFTIE